MIKVKHELFPTLVVSYKNFINDKQKSDITDYLNHIDFIHHSSLNGNAISSFSTKQNILTIIEENVDSCKQIKNQLNDVISGYANELGFNYDCITNSWVNIQYKGSDLIEHTHPLSSISGALYLETDELSSALYFHNPNNYFEYSNIKEHTHYSYHWIKFQPEIGELFLFPSWLKHGSNTEINNTERRIVLSFNAT
jgi:uncharacterized protein (TIGR02466 family)